MNIVQSLFTIVVQQLITEQAKFLFSALCLTILSEFSAVGKQQASDRERTYNQLIADIVQWGRVFVRGGKGARTRGAHCLNGARWFCTDLMHVPI
jgi:hypothetical protein